jgi:hypothetical protein
MWFINPMWDHESERIGKQKCTRLGYALHATSDLIGFLGLALLFGLGIARIVRQFPTWMFVIPFALGAIGSALYRYSWMLARRKGFRYDYDSREASWLENGERRTYKYAPSRTAATDEAGLDE